MPMRGPNFQEPLQCLLESFSLSPTHIREQENTFSPTTNPSAQRGFFFPTSSTQHMAETLCEVLFSTVQPSMAALPTMLSPSHSPMKGLWNRP